MLFFFQMIVVIARKALAMANTALFDATDEDEA